MREISQHMASSGPGGKNLEHWGRFARMNYFRDPAVGST